MRKERMRTDKVAVHKIVGENIRRERMFRKVSREELADLIDLTVSHVGLIERGERGATIVVITRIAKVLGLKLETLLNESNRHPRAVKPDKNSENIVQNKLLVVVSELNESEVDCLTQMAKGLIKLRKDKENY